MGGKQVDGFSVPRLQVKGLWCHRRGVIKGIPVARVIRIEHSAVDIAQSAPPQFDRGFKGRVGRLIRHGDEDL